MFRLFRLAKILWVAYRFGLDEFPLAADHSGRAQRWAQRLLFFRRIGGPRAVRLRRALETLGPIFVKFGQVLSTRRDLLPTDIADELAKLQDQVPPFDSSLAVREIERALGGPIEELFADFDRTPVACASQAPPFHDLGVDRRTVDEELPAIEMAERPDAQTGRAFYARYKGSSSRGNRWIVGKERSSHVGAGLWLVGSSRCADAPEVIVR